MLIHCNSCGGEGRLFTSRWGGNDPDVWPVGRCGSCNGTGVQKCDARGCRADAVTHNSAGGPMCADCIVEWDLAAGEVEA